MRVKPSFWGALFASSGGWSAEIFDEWISVVKGPNVERFHLGDDGAVTLDYRGRWATLVIRDDTSDWRLGGIPKLRATQFEAALAETRKRVEERRQALKNQQALLAREIPKVIDWATTFTDEMKDAEARRVWITREKLDDWLASKPSIASEAMLIDPKHQEFIKGFSANSANSLDWWNVDLGKWVSDRNQRFLSQEKVDEADFFDNVESRPLTDEQIEAVVCFDNRVQVIASAGSGKTSTMIAKTGYALHRGFIDGSGILMLAFNNKAALELAARTKARLGKVAEMVSSSTFHAFGMKVIGEATGRKPSLAPWLENGQDIQKIASIAAGLRDSSVKFRTAWGLFRLVFNQELAEFGAVDEFPDYDSATRISGYRTRQGEIVKSQEELLIANWLYYNGVTYEYEREYEIDTRTFAYRQYTPDFYFPEIDCYLEHFALDQNGQPPVEWTTYLDGVVWKRQVHQDNKTDLIETTSHTVRNGDAFTYLEQELARRGVELHPNSDRPESPHEVLTQSDMASLIRTFLTHVKNNQLSSTELAERAEKLSGYARFRARLFLRIFEPVRASWDSELRENDLVDFEDMLNLAADLIEAGLWDSPYDLIAVDEMQDANRARARLIRALVARQGRHLFAVGDDWQSINRFAGADLSIMTGFEDWFGPTQLLRLEKTFRSAETITDVSSHFIRKNPVQISKNVGSASEGGQITGIVIDDESKTSSAIRDLFDEYEERGEADSFTWSIFVLGRYRRNEEYVPSGLHRWPHLEVEYHTVHGSKGLEADIVIVTGLVERGFPSAKEDDPLLQLAMPGGDTFEHAEERRLFYVAMTRAKYRVDLITVAHKQSPFIRELIEDGHLTLETLEGEAVSTIPCKECGQGHMVPRSGPYGNFLGCSRFPKCRATLRVD